MFSGHALRRMFERAIDKDAVLAVVNTGEVIAEYPDDQPFASCLMLGIVEGRALHVVLALDEATQTGHIITAYPPDPSLWDSEFKTRRSV